MSLDLSPHAVSARLRAVARRADLRAIHRLDAKIDMGPAAVSRRLRTVGRVTSLCLRLGRRVPPGPSVLAAVCEDILELARLEAREEATRRKVAGPPGSPEPTALQGIRGERCRRAASITARLASDRTVLRHVLVIYMGGLMHQRGVYGFAWTPGVCAAAMEIRRHARDLTWPVLLIGPCGFPLAGLAEAALTGRVPATTWPWGAAAADSRASGSGRHARVHHHELRDGWPPPGLVGPSGFPHDAASCGGWVVSGFFACDAGAQRALRDAAARRREPLVIVECCAPARDGEGSWEGYALPEVGGGVSDRLHRVAVPALPEPDEATARAWLLAAGNWEEGLVPLESFVTEPNEGGR